LLAARIPAIGGRVSKRVVLGWEDLDRFLLLRPIQVLLQSLLQHAAYAAAGQTAPIGMMRACVHCWHPTLSAIALSNGCHFPDILSVFKIFIFWYIFVNIQTVYMWWG
jgi:hypothetical protein